MQPAVQCPRWRHGSTGRHEDHLHQLYARKPGVWPPGLIHPDKVVLEVPTLPEGASVEDIENAVALLNHSPSGDSPRLQPECAAAWLCPVAAAGQVHQARHEGLQARDGSSPGEIRTCQHHGRTDCRKSGNRRTVPAHAGSGRQACSRASGLPSPRWSRPDRPPFAGHHHSVDQPGAPAGSSAEIEELLKKDPLLSFNLLRFINSSGFGLSCEITSFRHAVMILGLKKLFRWAAPAADHVARQRHGPGHRHDSRSARAPDGIAGAEMLAPEECDNAFVVGRVLAAGCHAGHSSGRGPKSVALPEPVLDALLLTRACFTIPSR